MERFSFAARLLLWGFPAALTVLALALYVLSGRRGAGRP